jgi:asparagine synthase (glutamine-hydrolysing)
MKSLGHRGPDGRGEKSKVVSILGQVRKLNMFHTRLSIIDPVVASNQPFYSDCSRYTLIYNGEIYNHIELRSELESLGHTFKTHSDTEVLLKCYIQWAGKAVTRLRGIFAFCIWDDEENTLFMARDHLGVKPLYLANFQKSFALSSTIEAILKSGLIESPRLRQESIDHFVEYGSFDGKNTLIDRIKMFPAGHFAIYKNEQLSIERFWKMSLPEIPLKITYEEALSEITSELKEITKLQMRADVEVGAFLSGGIDSGMLVGLMSQHTSKPIHTYSIGFEDRHELLEWELARKTAKKFQTIHTEIKIDENNFKNSLDEFIAAIDHPTVDGLNSFFVSRETGKELKVAISGLGGDETFAGYYFYPLIQKSSKSPGLLQSLAGKLPYSLSKKGKLAPFRYPVKNLDSVLNIHRKIGPHGNKINGYEHIELKNDLFLSTTSIHELENYTPNTLLRDVDAVSMYHSLEVRVPFLDPHLIDFTLQLPDNFKVSRKYNKPLLVDSFPDLLPAEIINAPKRGFEMPVGHWISRAIVDELEDLPDKCERLGIEPSIVRESIRILQQNADHYVPVWRFIVLTSWLEHYGLMP